MASDQGILHLAGESGAWRLHIVIEAVSAAVVHPRREQFRKWSAAALRHATRWFTLAATAGAESVSRSCWRTSCSTGLKQRRLMCCSGLNSSDTRVG